MIHLRHFAPAALLIAAACGDQAAHRQAADQPGLPAPSPTVAQRALATFPEPFQGRWGMSPADCEPGRADAKGLMEIAATTVRFYESRGTVQELRQAAPDTLKVSLSLTGEGQTWSRAETLSLAADGALTREYPAETGPRRDRYTRCPATPDDA